jgi:hypothetical protein
MRFCGHARKAVLFHDSKIQFSYSTQFCPWCQCEINPPSYTFGNVGRTLPNVRAPKPVDFDVALHKTMPIHKTLASI